jgi:hypothetical protein
MQFQAQPASLARWQARGGNSLLVVAISEIGRLLHQQAIDGVRLEIGKHTHIAANKLRASASGSGTGSMSSATPPPLSGKK